MGAYASWLTERMRGGAMRPFVGGNSLGGAIALTAALQAPADIGGLVLIGTGARLRVSAQIFALLDDSWPAGVDTLVDLSLARAASEDLRRRVKSWHLQVGRRSTRCDYEACDKFDVMADVGRLSLPTLIIAGTEDRVTPPKYAHYLHDQIASSRLEFIPGAGHMPHLEQPAAVNALIRRFLTEHSAQRAGQSNGS